MLFNIDDKAYAAYTQARFDYNEACEGFAEGTVDMLDMVKFELAWVAARDDFLDAVIDPVKVADVRDLSAYGDGTAFIDSTGTVWRMEIQQTFYDPAFIIWRSFQPNGSTNYGGCPDLPLTPIFTTPREA